MSNPRHAREALIDSKGCADAHPQAFDSCTVEKRSIQTARRLPGYLVVAIALAAIAFPLTVALAGQDVKRVGNLYQWVDPSGRVIYGDSPPTVTQSRRVDARTSEGVRRSFPAAESTSQQPAPPARQAAFQGLNAAQLAALARLKPDLASALREAAGAAPAPQGSVSATTETPVAEPAELAGVELSPQITATAALAGAPVASTESERGLPKAADVEGGSAASVTAPTIEKTEAAPAPQALANVASSPSTVNLGIATTAVVDVARATPQLIETELSDKERVRMRRRSLAIGEQRFLDRLKNFSGTGN